MIVVARQRSEAILIGDAIRVVVRAVAPDHVVLAVEYPEPADGGDTDAVAGAADVDSAGAARGPRVRRACTLEPDDRAELAPGVSVGVLDILGDVVRLAVEALPGRRAHRAAGTAAPPRAAGRRGPTIPSQTPPPIEPATDAEPSPAADAPVAASGPATDAPRPGAAKGTARRTETAQETENPMKNKRSATAMPKVELAVDQTLAVGAGLRLTLTDVDARGARLMVDGELIGGPDDGLRVREARELAVGSSFQIGTQVNVTLAASTDGLATLTLVCPTHLPVRKG